MDDDYIKPFFFFFFSSNKTRVVRNEHFAFCYLDKQHEMANDEDGLFALPTQGRRPDHSRPVF